jgi:hypothetical protein
VRAPDRMRVTSTPPPAKNARGCPPFLGLSTRAEIGFATNASINQVRRIRVRFTARRASAYPPPTVENQPAGVLLWQFDKPFRYLRTAARKKSVDDSKDQVRPWKGASFRFIHAAELTRPKTMTPLIVAVWSAWAKTTAHFPSLPVVAGLQQMF